jgi:hypothetical protein
MIAKYNSGRTIVLSSYIANKLQLMVENGKRKELETQMVIIFSFNSARPGSIDHETPKSLNVKSN